MGASIAQVCAMSGYKVLLFDVNETMLSQGITHISNNLNKAVQLNKISSEQAALFLSNIHTVSNISNCIANLVIEAVVEKLEVKQKLFQDLELVNSPLTLFASNTSSIPIKDIAQGLQYPERMVGLHFFNPAHIMRLVEVVENPLSTANYVQLATEFVLSINKTPVLAKDAPGFIVNRIGKLYHTEPLQILEDGVATIEQIDCLMESCGFKMGPFKLIDLIGVDANLNVTKSMYQLFNGAARFKPSATQQKMVDDGHLGKKTNKGFYNY
jgi:3-hydroxybutyryl-CoA dehydrogenase